MRVAVDFFLKSSASLLDMPKWAEVIQAKRVDYGGDEVSQALPINLDELLPGLPDAALAASVDASVLVGDNIRHWLFNPQCYLLPEEEWPTEVPRATIQVKSEDEYYRICLHLLKIGILATIEFKDIFEVKRSESSEWNVRSIEER